MLRVEASGRWKARCRSRERETCEAMQAVDWTVSGPFCKGAVSLPLGRSTVGTNEPNPRTRWHNRQVAQQKGAAHPRLLVAAAEAQQGGGDRADGDRHVQPVAARGGSGGPDEAHR